MNKIFKKIVFIFLFFFSLSLNVNAQEKLKIGLLVPMTGDNKELGKLIIQSTRIALKDIKTNNLEIYPRDTGSNPTTTLQSASELKEMGIKIVIGPVFYNSSIYLNELEDINFISLTNKTVDLQKNVISSGVNAASQINAIKKFIELNDIEKTIFLTPKLDYEIEIRKAIKQSKIKISKLHIYETEPTKLTKQIEKITNYSVRKQNLLDEIERIENSDLNEEKKKEELIN